MITNKDRLRSVLGELPFTAELDWMLRQKNRARNDHFSLTRLRKSLPAAVKAARAFAAGAGSGKRILFFATLHYWIEQSAYISLVLAGLGHEVTLMTLPYAEWHKRMDNFTQRQRLLHTRDSLRPIEPLVRPISMLDLQRGTELPAALKTAIEEMSLWDTQYTLMREEVELDHQADRAVYDLRRERNSLAAGAALSWMEENKPEAVLVPNGLILELGAVFRAARYLGIPTMTYEFNDQREQIWLAQNS